MDSRAPGVERDTAALKAAVLAKYRAAGGFALSRQVEALIEELVVYISGGVVGE